MKILQISVHMGAGAGKAISGLAISDAANQHSIILLSKPEKLNHVEKCIDCGVEVCVCPRRDMLREKADDADVVVLNWWHHPLIYKALLDMQGIPARIVLWSHVNGLDYPVLKPEFALSFDAGMFTSKASFDNKRWNSDEKNKIADQTELIYGMGDFNPKSYRYKTSYEVNKEIIIGYVGSLDYAKLHPDFVSWLKEALRINQDVIFEVAGDINPRVREDVEKAGIASKVRLMGFRTDVQDLLSGWDVFIYPLNPRNFATTENALLEAMACGLPIVTSGGAVERTIIDDGETGLLAEDADGFARNIRKLILDKNYRRMLGEAARKKVIAIYALEENVSRFQELVQRVSSKPKSCYELSVIGNSPFDWFLMGCSDDDKRIVMDIRESLSNGGKKESVHAKVGFLTNMLLGREKGSVEQFARIFHDDEDLCQIASCIKEYREMNI